MPEDRPYRVGNELTVYPDRDEIALQSDKTESPRIKLEPRVMNVLKLLAEHDTDLVPRERFLREIWDDYESADEALTQAVSVLRKAIREVDGDPRIIETVPKKGYRLNQPVRALEVRSHGEGASPEFRRRKNAEGTGYTRPDLRKLAMVAILTILFLLAGLLIWDYFTGDAPAPESPPSEQVEPVE